MRAGQRQHGSENQRVQYDACDGDRRETRQCAPVRPFAREREAVVEKVIDAGADDRTGGRCGNGAGLRDLHQRHQHGVVRRGSDHTGAGIANELGEHRVGGEGRR